MRSTFQVVLEPTSERTSDAHTLQFEQQLIIMGQNQRPSRSPNKHHILSSVLEHYELMKMKTIIVISMIYYIKIQIDIY